MRSDVIQCLLREFRVFMFDVCVCDDLVIYICSMIFSDRYLASMYSICIYMCLQICTYTWVKGITYLRAFWRVSKT